LTMRIDVRPPSAATLLTITLKTSVESSVAERPDLDQSSRGSLVLFELAVKLVYPYLGGDPGQKSSR
jgi:hypothetical protein